MQTLGEVPDSFAVTAEHTDRLAAQAERLSQGELLRAIDLLAAAIAAVKEGSEPRLQLEVALLKATQPQADQSLQALMFRIDQLEAQRSPAGRRRPPGPAQRLERAGPPAPRPAAPADAASETPQACRRAARLGCHRPRGAAPRRRGGGRAAVRGCRGGDRAAAESEPRADPRSTSSACASCGPRWPTRCASRTRWSAALRRRGRARRRSRATA